MFRLIKYLKPFVGMLILAVILLFIQAMTDLALPDYMADIVNKGIQQGGITSAVPEAIRKSQMEKAIIFLNEVESEKVLRNYILLDETSSDFETYSVIYPALLKEPIYILKAIDNMIIHELNPIMGKALLFVMGIQRIQETAKDGVIPFDQIPADEEIYHILSQMTVEQRVDLIRNIDNRFIDMGEAMLIQGASAAVKAEYEALGFDTTRIQSRFIIGIGFKMLLLALLGALCTVIVGFLAAKIATGTGKNLRRDVFNKVESFSTGEFEKFSTASLITRTTNDVTQLQMVIILGIRMMVSAPMMGIGGVIKAIGKSSSMSWIIALAVLILICLISFVFIIAMPKFRVIQKLVDRLNLVTRENLSGIMVIRAFNTQKFEEKRFDIANIDLTKTNLYVNRVMAAMFPLMMLIMNGVMLLIVWVGAHRIAESSMQVGDMMAFMQYAMQIIGAFLMMSFMFIMIPRASVSAQRITEVLETNPSIIDPQEPKYFTQGLKGILRFRDVTFKYPGAEGNVLNNISFTAVPGKTTAIIGSTGSGKSTLVSLIPRFYDVSGGQITIDDVDIRDLTQWELRNSIGYVPQKGSLFKGTIESNIKYGDKDASLEDINQAINVAQGREIIEERTEGLLSEISQGGKNVSGGQKQRLSIARALIKKPKIYIFDDSFSSLDFKTDASLRKALMSHANNGTVIIVAQRISTIKNAEQIIVLEQGSVVGIGTHDELMKSCSTYQEIAFSQLSKEELA